MYKNQATVLCKVTNHKDTPVKTPIATPYLMKGVQSFYKYFSWRQKCRHHFKKYFVSMWVDGRIAVTFQTPFTCLELEGAFAHPNFKKISDNKKCPPVWESKYKSKTIVLLIHNSVGFFIDSYWQDYPLWFIIWA